MKEKDIAYIDDLTGINNRRAFKEVLDKDLSKPKGQIKGLYLAITDLDHFKKVNDTYGHLSGDYMIKEFARALIEGVKGLDNMVARYGGDEFIIILRKIDKEEAISTCDNIREGFSKREFLLPEVNKKIKITMSMGIAEYPTDGETPDKLFTKADEALYSSKRLGRNRASLAKDILAQVAEEKRVHDMLLKPQLIGRENELDETNNALFGEKPHKVLLIAGDIGAGKTRMLEEISRLSELNKAGAFFITCTEIEQDKPYGLMADIINAIRHKHYEVFKKGFDSLNKKQRSVLSTIPKLKGLTGASQPSFKWDSETRLNIFDAISELFSYIVENIRPVILIDNMDWIDEASMEVINYIIVSKKEVPLRICASDSRPQIAKGERKISFLDELLDEISEFEIVPRIDLGPLPKAQTTDLIQHIFPKADMPESFMDDIYLATKGNLFFITELLRDFLDSGIIHLKRKTWVFDVKKEHFPKDLKELLEKKFERLEQDEKELLLTAAGIGRSFKFDFLSKLKNINSGYAQDVIDRVADKNIFSKEEVALKEAASFNNETMRALLYKNIDADTKKQIHFNIATIMEKENKDNIAPVSAELAFHFDQAKLESEAQRYASVAVKYVNNLFSDKETERLIENAIKEREQKDKQEPIKKQSWPFVIEIISAFNAAVRSRRFYQRSNVITEKAVNRIIPALKDFFKVQDNLTLSTPQGEPKDSYKLLVNGQEFHIKSTAEAGFSKNLIDIMRDSHIASITFCGAISKKEIESFVSILEKPLVYSETKESWQKILSDKKIAGIKTDEVLYKRVLSEEEKKQHQKEFMKGFMATEAAVEAAAQAFKETATSTAPGGPAGTPTIDKKIKEVTKEEKNILAKTIAKLPHNVIVETIANEYRNRKKDILDIKDMFLVCFKDAEQKKTLLSGLQRDLKKLGMSKQCFEWLVDETDFLEYPAVKRANIYINTDPKTILEMGVLKNLKPTLEELFAIEEKEIVEEIINKYLQNLQSTDAKSRAYTAETMADIINILPGEIAADNMKKIVDIFLDSLTKEKEPAAYESLVENTSSIIHKLLGLEDYSDILRVLSMVKMHKNGETALKGIDISTLDNKLLETLKAAAFDKEKSELILRIFKLLGPLSIPSLIDLLLIRVSDSMPFEWYLQERQVIEVLREVERDTAVEIEKMLSSTDRKKIKLALEILMHFSDKELVHLYKIPLASNDEDIRKHAIKALIELDSDRAIELIKDLFAEESYDVQKYIIAAQGAYSKNKKVLEFLISLKETKKFGKLEKSLNEAIGIIKGRIGRSPK